VEEAEAVLVNGILAGFLRHQADLGDAIAKIVAIDRLAVVRLANGLNVLLHALIRERKESGQS